MDQREQVRQSYFIEGKSIRRIAREGLHDRRTVRKSLHDAGPPRYTLRVPRRRPVLEPFLPVIDQWLKDDEDRPSKQRHTAHRIYDGVPGATFEEVMERCLAYKRETNVDVVCPAVQSWEENKEAIQRIPGPVLPLFTHGSQTHPTLEELQEAGAAGAWYPALTSMAGLQANWDLLSDFKDRGTQAIDDFLQQTAQSKWGTVSNGSILGADHIREMEDKYLPG